MFLIKLFKHKARVLAINEALCRAIYNSVTSLSGLYLTDLIGSTEILTEDHRMKLCPHMMACTEGHDWSLAFSTSQHGFCLHSLYRLMLDIEGPVLLIMRDDESNVFGAVLSCAPKLTHREHIFGTGQSFLFRFTPEFKVFKWTGCNMNFILAKRECLSIGGGDGKCGLWVDQDLDKGRTEPCKTFDNERLSSHEDFHILTLECWEFV